MAGSGLGGDAVREIRRVRRADAARDAARRPAHAASGAVPRARYGHARGRSLAALRNGPRLRAAGGRRERLPGERLDGVEAVTRDLWLHLCLYLCLHLHLYLYYVVLVLALALVWRVACGVWRAVEDLQFVSSL